MRPVLSLSQGSRYGVIGVAYGHDSRVQVDEIQLLYTDRVTDKRLKVIKVLALEG